MQQAPGDEVKYGNQDTDGSRSTRHYLIPMRQIGASARAMLEGAAAKRWGVPVTEVKASNHEVVHGASGRRIGFGDLAADAANEPVPAYRKPEAEGSRRISAISARAGSASSTFATSRSGAARYGADVRLPGMKYAVIARPPVTGGKLVSFDGTDAMKVSGVEKVMEVRAGHGPRNSSRSAASP